MKNPLAEIEGDYYFDEDAEEELKLTREEVLGLFRFEYGDCHEGLFDGICEEEYTAEDLDEKARKAGSPSITTAWTADATKSQSTAFSYPGPRSSRKSSPASSRRSSFPFGSAISTPKTRKITNTTMT